MTCQPTMDNGSRSQQMIDIRTNHSEISIVETEDPKKDFQIFEIESAGYVLVGEGQTEVVIPSRVSIYRFKSNTEEEK